MLKNNLQINGFFVNFDVKIGITEIVWSKELNMISSEFQAHLLIPKIYR